MSPNQLSRRSALASGGALIGLGITGVSAVKLTADDDRTPGADGFTAKTVPAGSDPLVLIDPDSTAQNDVARDVTMTLLGARQFEDLPKALVGAFESESKSVVDLDSVGKLVLAGSKVTEGGGAVVWADWTDDELVAVLQSSGKTEITTESYEERTLYTTGKISAAVLGDDQFALGTPEVVRDIVDVWYGDAEPVGGTTLDSFERTPREACVRFSFEKLRLACDGLAAQSEVYDAVTQIYGSVPPEGDEVRLRLRVESSAATSEVATAVSDALGLGNRDGSEVNTILPPKARDDVTVGHEHDFVAVEYTQHADEDVTSAGGIIETIVCMTGHSR